MSKSNVITKLKITDPKGDVRIVPFNKKTANLHIRLNKLKRGVNTNRIEVVEGIEVDELGNIVQEGSVTKVLDQGTVNHAQKLAETTAALSDKDTKIAELQKLLDAANKKAQKAETQKADPKAKAGTADTNDQGK